MGEPRNKHVRKYKDQRKFPLKCTQIIFKVTITLPGVVFIKKEKIERLSDFVACALFLRALGQKQHFDLI